MRCRRSFVFLCALPLLMSGCGGSPGSGSSAPTYDNLTGNWSLILIPSNPLVVWPLPGGYLMNTNGAVSGTLHMNNSSCYSLTADIPVTGTLTSTGNIDLTSAAVGGQTLSITGVAIVFTIPPATETIGTINGTYTISGGCADGQNGRVDGRLIPPVNGVYTGTFESVSGQNIGVSLNVSQAGPNADGEFSVSGPVTFTGSPCFTTGSITSSTIFGDYIDVTISASNNGTMEFTGEILDTVPVEIDGLYKVTAGACAGDSGGGTVTQS